ncbi:MAG: HIT domain-containing protein [Candidatus Paracaedibacteraceae bacterium]|nr:HIT domain-containing protein [Candidatus Paracaedibacteraceae bacterium]
MANKYDDQNVFAKILRGEIPSKKIAEDDHTLVFHDAFPKAKYHILIIPKKAYISFQDFSESASSEEIVSLNRMIGQVASMFNLDKTGYRLLTNHGKDSNQEVPHFHVHLCGGEPLGPLLSLKK